MLVIIIAARSDKHCAFAYLYNLKQKLHPFFGYACLMSLKRRRQLPKAASIHVYHFFLALFIVGACV